MQKRPIMGFPAPYHNVGKTRHVELLSPDCLGDSNVQYVEVENSIIPLGFE